MRISDWSSDVCSSDLAGVQLAYEAAVAGGIPMVKALREGLAGNRIESVYGILNGTCNYILSTMRGTGREFEDVLAEAQRLGYAEADRSQERRVGIERVRM